MTAQQMFGSVPDAVEMASPANMTYLVYVSASFSECPRLPCEECTREKQPDGEWRLTFCGWHQRMRLDMYPNGRPIDMGIVRP